jgi:flagellar biosynthetic protein FliR
MPRRRTAAALSPGAVIMFVNGAMGVVGRAVPQVNVFVTSFPVNIMVGLSVFMVSIPLLLATMEQDLGRLTGMIFKFLRTF